jgi:hypothetical protein
MSQLAIQRLHNQFLAAPHPGSVAEMVAALGAVQGQDYLGTLWSIGLRSGQTQAQVEEAYAQPAAQASFVRSWVLRGTLHFVHAADLGWMLELLAPRLLSVLERRYRELELDAHTLEHSTRVLVETIQAEGALARKALLARLEAVGILTAGQRGIHLLQHASLQGLIYQAAVQRNQAVFELCERMPPGTSFPHRKAALGELARRYFTTHGPATVQDFIWWSGLTAAEARQGLGVAQKALRAQEAQAGLVSQVVCGITYWQATDVSVADASAGDAPAALQVDPQRAFLLPGFDEFLISYKDRTASISPEHQKQWMSNKNGMLISTMVIGGKVVGAWKRTLEKQAVRVEIQPFAPLSHTQDEAIRAAAQQYANFLELPLRI